MAPVGCNSWSYLSFRVDCWSNLEIWHTSCQWSWQAFQLFSGRQGLFHSVGQHQWEVLWIYFKRRNKPWKNTQCGTEWYTAKSESCLLLTKVPFLLNCTIWHKIFSKLKMWNAVWSFLVVGCSLQFVQIQ